MMENTTKPWALGMTVAAGAARLVQNLNFAPVGALSLFAGARLRGWQAYALPIALMALTDPLRGGYSAATPFVYVSFLISVWFGAKLRRTENPVWIGGMALAGSVQFFLLSNLPAWLFYPEYAHNVSGLISCYAAALPFYRNTLLSDLAYTAVLFGLHALLSRRIAAAERVVTVNRAAQPA
jgi:hypothetical protein